MIEILAPFLILKSVYGINSHVWNSHKISTQGSSGKVVLGAISAYATVLVVLSEFLSCRFHFQSKVIDF
jgi:hypothetical protein